MRPTAPVYASIMVVALSLVSPTALGAQQDTTRISVRGVVGDASAGTPLQGAVASVPELRIRTLTDDQGRFLLEDVPGGNYVWRFQMLGYADWEEEIEVQNGEFLRVGLLPRPIVLENITVTVDRLERRRKTVAHSVVVVSREEISRAAAGSAYDLVRSRSPVPFRECPPPRIASPLEPLGNESGRMGARDAWADLFSSECVYSRGRTIRPALFIDEEMTPSPLEMLSAYSADEIHTVEYYSYGTHIRVYTRYFVASGRRLLPINFSFRRF